MPADTAPIVLAPKPPPQTQVNSITDVNTVLEQQARYNRQMLEYNTELYQMLHEQYLVKNFRVDSLTANTITSGTITSDQIYLFDERFELNGATGQIIVKDENGTTRFVAGKFGSGTDYGAKVFKSDGSVLYDLTGLGANVVTNSNIQSGAVTADKVTTSSLSALSANMGTLTAGTITAGGTINAGALKTGTLTVNSSTVAINVTSAGAVVFSAGGDIIMRASGTDHNFISFRTSGNAERANIAYNSATNIFTLQSLNGANLRIQSTSTAVISLTSLTNTVTLGAATGTAVLGTTSNYRITANGRFQSDLNPAIHNNWNLGLSGLRWANIWGVLINGADICFDNGWRITEPDKVWKGASGHDGLLIMNEKWEVMMGFDRYGNIFTRGFVHPGFGFKPADVPKRTSEEEGDEVHEDGTEYIN